MVGELERNVDVPADRTIFVLGAAGFIGTEVIKQAVQQGSTVRALVRSEQAASTVEVLGATAVLGDARQPGAWLESLSQVGAVIDLVQPHLPNRLSAATLRAAVHDREAVARALIQGLVRLPAEARPRLLAVSGTSDLAPDDSGRVSDRSGCRARPVGFAHIGLAVRRLLLASSINVDFVHLGIVYGFGKAFARLLPQLLVGKVRVIGCGTNRLALVHVKDAARALVHIASLQRQPSGSRTWVVALEDGPTQLQLFSTAANVMGAPMPRRVPAWLASLLVGKRFVETLTTDVVADPSALLASGFHFEMPLLQVGLADTALALGYGHRQPQP